MFIYLVFLDFLQRFSPVNPGIWCILVDFSAQINILLMAYLLALIVWRLSSNSKFRQSVFVTANLMGFWVPAILSGGSWVVPLSLMHFYFSFEFANSSDARVHAVGYLWIIAVFLFATFGVTQLFDQKISFDLIFLLQRRFFELRPILIMGMSYIFFRMLLAHADYRKTTPVANFAEYLSYLVYFPACFVGPMSDYGRFIEDGRDSSSGFDLRMDNLLRIIVGALKFFVLSAWIRRLTFDSYVFDGNYHALYMLPLVALAYYLFLFLNFSGFCDVVIGFSRLFSIKIDENFDNPIRATSLAEFWRRWHKTLGSVALRFVYTPIVFTAVRKFGVRARHVASVAGLMLTFLVIGLWHGFDGNFFLFGLLNAVGMGVWYLWHNFGPKNHTRPILMLYWLLTQGFVALTLVFFANSYQELLQLLDIMR